MKRLLTLCLLLTVSGTAYSDGSPWLLPDGAININLTRTEASSDDFFIGDTSTDIGGTLEGEFTWLKATYGLNDVWAFDARIGYAETSFEGSLSDQADFADTSIGVSYQFINEFEADNGTPTITGRLGYTIGGDYEPDIIEAIGDGASGFDVSLLVGKSLTPAWAVFGDLTFRQRDSGVPDGIKYIVGGSYNPPIPYLSFLLSLAGTRTDSDINLGGGGLGIDEFSQTDRDSDLVVAGFNLNLPFGIGFGASYSAIIDASNQSDSDVLAINLGYTF